MGLELFFLDSGVSRLLNLNPKHCLGFLLCAFEGAGFRVWASGACRVRCVPRKDLELDDMLPTTARARSFRGFKGLGFRVYRV